MEKFISVFSHTSRSNKTIDYDRDKGDFIWDMYLDGKLKSRPYWDEGEDRKGLIIQAKKGQFKSLIKKIRNYEKVS